MHNVVRIAYCWDSVLRHPVFHSGSLLAWFLSVCLCWLAARVRWRDNRWPRLELWHTPCNVWRLFILLSYTTESAQLYCIWRQLCWFSLLMLLNLFELATARPLPFVESAVVRSYSDAEDEGQFCPTTDAVAVPFSAGNRYRQRQTSADVDTRESRFRSSGRRSSSHQPTRYRRSWVQRYEPGLVTSFVDRAVSTRQPTSRPRQPRAP